MNWQRRRDPVADYRTEHTSSTTLLVRALNMHMHTMCIRARSIHIMHSIHERTFKVTFAEPSAITSPPAKLLAISLRLSIVRILDFIFS